MIDKYIIKFLSFIDNFCSALAKMLESKPKKKRKTIEKKITHLVMGIRETLKDLLLTAKQLWNKRN